MITEEYCGDFIGTMNTVKLIYFVMLMGWVAQIKWSSGANTRLVYCCWCYWGEGSDGVSEATRKLRDNKETDHIIAQHLKYGSQNTCFTWF